MNATCSLPTKPARDVKVGDEVRTPEYWIFTVTETSVYPDGVKIEGEHHVCKYPADQAIEILKPAAERKLYYVEYANGNCSVVRTDAPELLKQRPESAKLVREASRDDVQEFLAMGGAIRS